MKAKEKILNTFYKLLSELDYFDISISMLCKEAKVHRTTFYLYYNNLYDVLLETQEIAFKKLQENTKVNFNTSIDLISTEILIPYLKFIKENTNLYLAFLTNASILKSDIIYNNLFENFLKPSAETITKNSLSEKEIKYIIDFYIGGISFIVKSWIKSNFDMSEEDLAKLIVNIKKGINKKEHN